STWLLSLLLLSLVVYSVVGGLRAVVGVTFLLFLFAHWILLLLYKPISLIDYSHYQPVLQTSVIDLLKGAKSTTFTLSGFEILFLIYPFIQNKEKAWRPILFGVSWSAGLILLTTLITIGYFSAQQMETIEWWGLSLFKTVKLPFIARFDFIVGAAWMAITLPTMMLFMWAIIYWMKRVYNPRKITTLYVGACIIYVLSDFIMRHHLIIMLTSILSNIGFWIIFVLPFVLLPLVLLKKWWRPRPKRSEKP